VEVLSRVGGGSLALRLQQSEPAAIDEALKVIADEKSDRARRLQYIQIFAAIGQPKCVPVLLELAASSASDELRSAALTTLGSYQDEQIAAQLVKLYGQLPPAVRDVALSQLASRANWALQLLEAVDRKQVAVDSVPAATIRQIMLHSDARIGQLVEKHWGQLQNATTTEMRAEIERVAGLLERGSGDPYSGKKLFAEHCGKCHVLFGQGGFVGPDLTSYQRSDLSRVLVNVVNPSIEIREGFENYVAVTEGGRVVTGFIADQDNRVVVLRGVDGQSQTLQREELDDLRAVNRSIMPEGVLKPLSDQQLRDLFAYLRATQPLP
jgi:putative heme-binding domain-containing protein